jgi:hypothetical protein
VKPLLNKALFLFFTLALCSCGIESYPYLAPVQRGGVFVDGVSRAVIQLPSPDPSFSSSYFMIFYRIYISGVSLTSISESQLRDINSTLNSDYVFLKTYTTSNGSVDVPPSDASLFVNRGFHTLQLEGTAIDVLLGLSSGTSITLDFNQTPGSVPRLITAAGSYPLIRNNSVNLTPGTVDNYFRNHGTINPAAPYDADVVRGNVPNPSPRYTYVVFYIVSTGWNVDLTSTYSVPTFIGVLRLPEP